MRAVILLMAIIPGISASAGFSANVKLRTMKSEVFSIRSVVDMDVVATDIPEFDRCKSVKVIASYNFFRWKIQRNPSKSPTYFEHKKAVEQLKLIKVGREFVFTIYGQGLLKIGECAFTSEALILSRRGESFEIISFYLTN